MRLLTKVLPVYPGNLWCHTRMVYLPMSFLYGIKYQAPVDDLIRSLREELFLEPFEQIQWSSHRNTVASVDLYHPVSPIMNLLNSPAILRRCFQPLRNHCQHKDPKISNRQGSRCD